MKIHSHKILAILFIGFPSLVTGAEENASNPLAKVKNTDIRWQYLDGADGGRVNDLTLEGAFMARPNLKLKYELHYWETNAMGVSENNWERIDLKAIFFGKDGKWNDIGYRPALGIDWILDLGDQSKGIGSGSDQIAPFAGVSMQLPSKTSVIPLVQQFISYNGASINTTAFRVIAIQPLPSDCWLKLDAIAPIEWANDERKPVSAELQAGKHFTPLISLYADILIGIGGDKPYDYGTGLGLRFKY